MASPASDQNGEHEHVDTRQVNRQLAHKGQRENNAQRKEPKRPRRSTGGNFASADETEKYSMS